VHAGQAVVTGGPFSTKYFRVDALSVVADSHPKLALSVPDFPFDPRCMCVSERIAHGFD
jgi:hypothetical protein